MEDAAQKEVDLQKNVGESLGISPQEVNPNDQSPLQKVKESVADATGEIVHIIGSPVDEMARGKESHTEFKESRSWHRRWRDRIKGMMPLKKTA